MTQETIESKRRKKKEKKKENYETENGRGEMGEIWSFVVPEKEKLAKGNHGRRIESSSVIKKETGSSTWRIIARNRRKNSFGGTMTGTRHQDV